MHREILGITSEKSLSGDHIDGNTLNNQRSNLRIATTSQNSANRKAKKNGTSNYLGVYKHIVMYKEKSHSYWVAMCRKEGKQIRKYGCKSETEATLAYNEMAKKYHGEFAKLNII